jgi:hypothetical protein
LAVSVLGHDVGGRGLREIHHYQTVVNLDEDLAVGAVVVVEAAARRRDCVAGQAMRLWSERG